MFFKILNRFFLTLTITPLIVLIDTYIAQAGKCKPPACAISTSGGSYSPPIIPPNELALHLAAVRERRATDVDYLILGHNALNNKQYSQANRYYSQANQMAAATQNKEVQATAQFWLGEVSNTLGNRQQAIGYFGQSSEIFKDLGDSQRANQVQFRQNQLQLQPQLQPQLQQRQIELQRLQQ